jgi:hypothetical protein
MIHGGWPGFMQSLGGGADRESFMDVWKLNRFVPRILLKQKATNMLVRRVTEESIYCPSGNLVGVVNSVVVKHFEVGTLLLVHIMQLAGTVPNNINQTWIGMQTMISIGIIQISQQHLGQVHFFNLERARNVNFTGY